MQNIEQKLVLRGVIGENASEGEPTLVIGMKARLLVRSVNESGTASPPANISDVASWKFILAEDWNPATNPCYIADAEWNPATATWTILLDGTRTAEMLSALGTDGVIDIGCEIAGLPENGTWDKPLFVVQWTMPMRNRRDSDGSPSPVDPSPVPAHAAQHAAGGADELTPAAIGAAAEAHSHDRIASPVGNTVLAASGGGEAFLSRPAGRDITYAVAEATVTLRWPATVRDRDVSAEIISVTGIPNPTVSGHTINSNGEYWGEFVSWRDRTLPGYVPDSFGGFPMFFVLSLSRLEPGSAQDETLGATQRMAVLLDADRNFLPRADEPSLTVTLAPQTAVYRTAMGSDGSFPTVDATAIPTASAYYCFELELTVPSTVPAAITGPSGWDWLDGGEPPDPSVLSGGETIFVACRMDCATRAVTANVWRVA